MLNAIIAETGVLPPAIALRAVKEFAANRELDAALRETVERTAHAMWPDDDGEGALFRKTAAALRALIGAPVKVSKKPAKPAPVQASKTKTKAKTPAKTSFADAVRRHMKGACPGYRFLSTSGGSGPLVTFERASPAKMRELKERVVFQKGLHGASWFRVSFFADIEGAGANGGVEHTVLEGAPLGKDVSFESNSALEAALGEACARLEATAARVFAPVEKRFRDLDRLFGHLVAHYSRFLAAEGAKLSSDDFVETEGSNPSTVVAFDAFVRSLVKQKLIFKDSKIDLATPLWRFWHDGRPMRASDYRKGDYYDCATCRAFVSFSKGKLVPRKVSGFGVHHAFVCNKH